VLKQSKNPHDPHDAKRLCNEFIAGDDKAYSSIYELYAKDLYAYGISLRVKNELIEDAIHDVFVEIYTHRQNLEKVENLKYYFIAAFRNRLFFLLKKESNTLEITEKHTLDFEDKNVLDTWIELEVESEKQFLLKKLLSELNQHQREALYHRFVENLSCEEIADLMQINYQSTKNLIHRAIKKLRLVSTLSLIFFLVVYVLKL
jgi:RNA polymerase sigma factor (sigma-70 family)